MKSRFWRIAEEFLVGDSRTLPGRISSALFWLIIGGCIYLIVTRTACLY